MFILLMIWLLGFTCAWCASSGFTVGAVCMGAITLLIALTLLDFGGDDDEE